MRDGIYRHYKGGRYQLLMEATHTETDETLAVYKSLLDGKVYARPFAMFLGTVEVDGKTTHRFTLEG